MVTHLKTNIMTKVILIVIIIKTKKILPILIGYRSNSPKSNPNHMNVTNSFTYSKQRTNQNFNSNSRNNISQNADFQNRTIKNNTSQNVNSQNHTFEKNNFQKNSSNNSNPQNKNLLIQDVYGKENAKQQTSNQSTSTNSSPDFSALFQTFFQNNTNSQNNEQNSNNTTSSDMPDFETILKFKKIFERLQANSNANEPIVNLLYAIKPFIQEPKKSIIDQIVKFITISSVLKDFNGIF